MRGKLVWATLGFLAVVLAMPVAQATDTVQVRLGDDLAALVLSSAPGTTFLLPEGRFSIARTVAPLDGDRLIGAGAGLTVISGGGAMDCIGGSSSGVEVAGLTTTGCVNGIRPRTRWNVHEVEATGNQIGIRISGDNVTLTSSALHDNTRYGLVASGVGNRIVGNDMAHNRTDTTYNASGSKWVHSTDTLIQGNFVHDNYGNGIWLDEESRGSIIDGNTVVNNADDGIRVEISSDTRITNNHVEGNGGSAIDVVNSRGTLVQVNTVSSPSSQPIVVRFLGNGRMSASRVEYTNTDNHAYSNAIRLVGTQLVGVFRTAGTTGGNSFDLNSYTAPDAGRHWKWWTGSANVKADWTGWRGACSQDSSGSLTFG